ncbi:MAG: hypothetical protein WKG06_25115 [Segetibacter sp.]
MKKSIIYLILVMIVLTSNTSCMQKYKTAADMGKLNKEYTEVSNDVAELTSKLTVAQNDLPAYESKAKAEEANAQIAAAESSQQAAMAKTGDLGDVKKAKRKPTKHLMKRKIKKMQIRK